MGANRIGMDCTMSGSERVLEALSVCGRDGLTLDEIHVLTEVPAATASAAIRHMRAVDGIKIESRRPEHGGPWTYHLEETPCLTPQ
jgi:hypothetical protein